MANVQHAPVEFHTASARSGTRPKVTDAEARAGIGRYMTTAVQVASAQSTIADAHALMRKRHARHLPIVDGAKIVGIVSLHDLHYAEGHGGTGTTPLRDVMEPAVVVAIDAPLARVARDMAARKHLVVLVEDGGRLVGIFTAVDALSALADMAVILGA